MPIPRSLAAGGALAALLAGGLALYGTFSKPGNLATAPSGPCAQAAAAARRVAPLAMGEVAAFEVARTPRPVPALAFEGPEGQALGLDAFRGRTVLLNLWATWCAPCKAEMPALDRLQADLGGEAFDVVAVNVETRNLERPRTWLRDNGIGRLTYYGDPDGRLLPLLQQHTGSAGLPTTLLVDARGCEIGVVKGPADWGSEDAKRLIRSALGRS